MRQKSAKHKRRDGSLKEIPKWFNFERFEICQLKRRRELDAFKDQLDDPFEPEKTVQLTTKWEAFVWERDIDKVS